MVTRIFYFFPIDVYYSDESRNVVLGLRALIW